jgi:hypothetical protein
MIDTPATKETTEARLGRWECLVIKCFAILFLILFLSEKAVKEIGNIRRAWATEIQEPLGRSSQAAPGITCSGAGEQSSTGTRRGSAQDVLSGIQ